MKTIKFIWSVLTEALFPASDAEKAMYSLAPEEALKLLPPAPTYGMTVEAMPGTRSLFAYKDPIVRCLVLSIKNKKDTHALRVGGRSLLSALVGTASLRDKTFLVPIPITKKRRRERGFNQCELLIEEVVRLDSRHVFAYEKDLLLRSKNSGQQKKKDREGRLDSSSDIFAISKVPSVAKDSHIVVIDDVITTGSTMKAALDALKAAGFNNVRGLSLAH